MYSLFLISTLLALGPSAQPLDDHGRSVAIGAKPPIELPVSPSPQPVVQKPASVSSDGVIEIGEGEVYIFKQLDPKRDAVLEAGSLGIVSITKRDNRRTIDGKALVIPYVYDGKVVGQTTPPPYEYDAPVIWIVRPQSKGVCDLLTWFAKGSLEGEPTHWRIAIKTGTAPRPPPTPPGPSPIPAPTGFRAILIEETSQNTTMEEMAILNSPRIAEYLNRKTEKDPDGKAGWRKWDKDVVMGERELDLWKALWAETKPKITSTPQLLIVTGGNGKLYPLKGMTEAEVLALLKQVGGE